MLVGPGRDRGSSSHLTQLYPATCISKKKGDLHSRPYTTLHPSWPSSRLHLYPVSVIKGSPLTEHLFSSLIPLQPIPSFQVQSDCLLFITKTRSSASLRAENIQVQSSTTGPNQLSERRRKTTRRHQRRYQATRCRSKSESSGRAFERMHAVDILPSSRKSSTEERKHEHEHSLPACSSEPLRSSWWLSLQSTKYGRHPPRAAFS